MPADGTTFDPLAAIIGDRTEMAAVLADYDGDLEAFKHDCTLECHVCGRLFYHAFGAAVPDFDADNNWTCEECEYRLFNMRAGSIWDEGRAA